MGLDNSGLGLHTRFLESSYDLNRQVFSVEPQHSLYAPQLPAVECQSEGQNYGCGAEIQSRPGSEFH